MSPELWASEWASFKSDIEARFAAFKLEVSNVQEKHHSENRTRLQAIDAQGVATGVKVDKLYGSDGQPGVVDNLAKEVKGLGNKIIYASGFVAAVFLLVGWYIEHGK